MNNNEIIKITNITITKRFNDYHACLENHLERFNLKIVEKAK